MNGRPIRGDSGTSAPMSRRCRAYWPGHPAHVPFVTNVVDVAPASCGVLRMEPCHKCDGKCIFYCAHVMRLPSFSMHNMNRGHHIGSLFPILRAQSSHAGRQRDVPMPRRCRECRKSHFENHIPSKSPAVKSTALAYPLWHRPRCHRADVVDIRLMSRVYLATSTTSAP